MSNLTADMLAATDVRDVVEGQEIVTKDGTDFVKKIGYANDIHRCGWKFTFVNGTEPVQFGFHNEKVLVVTR